MKKSEASKLLNDWIDSNGAPGLELLNYLVDKLGFFPPDSYYDEDEGIVPFWELEDEEYEEYEALKQEFPDNPPRDFTFIPSNSRLSSRSNDIVQSYLAGKGLQELADQYNVTRERIRQIVYKARHTALITTKVMNSWRNN